MSKKIVIVLAGNRQQYDFFLSRILRRDREENEYIYADSIQRIMGLMPYDVATVGTFWDRPDAGEIFEYAQERKKIYSQYS